METCVSDESDIGVNWRRNSVYIPSICYAYPFGEVFFLSAPAFAFFKMIYIFVNNMYANKRQM